MKFWVGITDKRWFNYLSELTPDEVNFWQPGGTQTFRAIEPGAPFLFKLHAPDNYVVGGGFFVRHSLLPLSLAWDVFGQKNGTPDIATLRERIFAYRRRSEAEPIIGCIILANPFFFPEHKWITMPPDWSPNIVQGKTYDDNEQIGLRLWSEVRANLHDQRIMKTEAVSEDVAPIGPEYLVRARLGQGSFRILVTEAYQRRCAVTGEKTLPALQAAHIKPYILSGPNHVNNGLLLRADLHLLFDKGYMTITPDMTTEVSKRIREEFHNGKEYYALQGKHLALPDNMPDRPSPEFISWHRQNVFVA